MDRAQTFEGLRAYLFSIAYRMVGSVAEAEDVVQDAYLRWMDAEGEIENPKAYLSKVVTRLAIDHLKSARVRRETYVGPWLPEPLVEEAVPDASEHVEQVESLSLAFLVLLETLTPVERAVFILREVFDYDYSEIAGIVDRSEDNCRQIAHRAKQHISARRPRFAASREKREELTTRFLEACALGDIEGLTSVLAEEVTLLSDGGGKARAARKPIVGRRKVARFILGILGKVPEGTSSEVVWVNGERGVALFEGDEPTSLLALDMSGDGVIGVHIIANPEKLEGLRR